MDVDKPDVAHNEAAGGAGEGLKENRALLVGFPDAAREVLAENLRQWEMESHSAENITIAVARLSEAAELGRPYRVALVYAGSADADIAGAATQLRAQESKPFALILCAPRSAASAWDARMSAQFSSVVELPPEKRLLYHALHSVLKGEQAAAGVISLTDYYKRKAPPQSYNVLVAEHDQLSRGAIAKELEKADHHVKLVADGEQALDALIEADYDVVILDSQMPVMAGLEAARLIRVMQAGQASVPIIMLSADATAEISREATAAGVSEFLLKPVEASKLYATVEQLTRKMHSVTP